METKDDVAEIGSIARWSIRRLDHRKFKSVSNSNSNREQSVDASQNAAMPNKGVKSDSILTALVLLARPMLTDLT